MTPTPADNPSLPVLACQVEILATLASSSAMVVVGDTGSGKSTQIPRMFLEAGHRVLVTEPRRLAVATLAERVAFEMGVEVGGLVGYRTGRDVPHDGPETRLSYMTDALVLMRELCGDGGGYDVLVLDEVHEFGLTVEVLLAWARRQHALAHVAGRPPPFKLVLLSATLDAERLAAYLGTPSAPAPIVRVPGRLYPIEDRPPRRPAYGMDDILAAMATEVRALREEGHETLAFVPGKGEIEALTLLLQGLDAEILPLHGQMTREEQARCFLSYPRPRVVIATNLAQTSLTIDGIDAVVDSGWERRVEVRNGVEGIYLAPISQASSTQRRGRAGRTKRGIFIDHGEGGTHPPFPVPEIRRVLLDQAVLRLAQAGIDAALLPFFHQPPEGQTEAAKLLLQRLGAMTEDGEVTAMGASIARLPVSVRAGRALVEASRRGGRALLDAVAAACAVVDVGSIGNDRMGRRWRAWAGPHVDSDLLAQTRALAAVNHFSAEELETIGFLPLKVVEAWNQRTEVMAAATEVLGEGAFPDRPLDLVDVVRCMAVAMVDQLRCRSWNDGGWPVFGPDERRIGRESVVDPGPRLDARDGWGVWDDEGPTLSDLWIVGIPFDIGAPRGTVQVLRAVSVVKIDEMAEIAPEAVQVIRGPATYDPRLDATMAWEEVRLFGETVVGRPAAVLPGAGVATHLHDFLTRACHGAKRVGWDAPHLQRLAEILAARARAFTENARLGQDRWPQPPVAKLVARIPDDAVSLGPHLDKLVVLAPPKPVRVKAGRGKRTSGVAGR